MESCEAFLPGLDLGCELLRKRGRESSAEVRGALRGHEGSEQDGEAEVFEAGGAALLLERPWRCRSRYGLQVKYK